MHKIAMNLEGPPRSSWSLSEVTGKELKVDTTDVGQKVHEKETWDMPGGPEVLWTISAIQMVDGLNVEVRRVVAMLGKELQKTKFEEGNRQVMQITEKARLMLGENMVALLSEGLLEKTRLDPLLVQVALQVAITNWCNTTISSWKPGNSDASDLLSLKFGKLVSPHQRLNPTHPYDRNIFFFFRRSHVLPSLAISNLGANGVFIQRLVPRSLGWIARYSRLRWMASSKREPEKPV